MRIALFIAALFISAVTNAQSAFSLRFFGLTIHPMGDQTSKLQPYRIDENAYFVANFGAYASIDKYFWFDRIAITFMQGAFMDCSGGKAGFTHFGLRALAWERGGHRFLIGAGPLFYYRESWNRFSDYTTSGFFRDYTSVNFGDVQYKLLPGVEIAWHWKISEHIDLNVGITPGGPVAIPISAGVTWWPKRIAKKEIAGKFFIRKKRKTEGPGASG